MLGLVDERGGVFNGTLFYQVRPELLGHVKLGVDLQGLFNGDNLTVYRGVIQLTVGFVTGTSVVEHPGVPCPRAIQSFQYGDIQLGCQFLCQCGKGDTHNACADNNYLHSLCPPESVVGVCSSKPFGQCTPTAACALHPHGHHAKRTPRFLRAAATAVLSSNPASQTLQRCIGIRSGTLHKGV